MVTESIYDNGQEVIPMAEVGHIEIDQRKNFEGAIRIIFKYSRWTNDEIGYEPFIHLLKDEANKFLKSWCRYRAEVEGIESSPESISEKMRKIWQ